MSEALMPLAVRFATQFLVVLPAFLSHLLTQFLNKNIYILAYDNRQSINLLSIVNFFQRVACLSLFSEGVGITLRT